MNITIRILASIQVVIAVFTALAGSFADGGQWWERLVLVGVHPAAAILLLVLVFRRTPTKGLAGVAVSFLSLNIVADIMLAVAISSGVTKGDWLLPLIFAVIPAIVLPDCVSRLRLRHCTNITIRILASIQVAISVLAAIVVFPDGGQWWEGLVLFGVHPAAAILLLVLVFSRTPSKGLAGVAVSFLSLNIVADIMSASAISSSVARDGWWLVLVFAAIPAIALPDCALRLRLRR